ncbi:MAG: DNA topoisomerase I [Planctomycetaceae bacterium]
MPSPTSVISLIMKPLSRILVGLIAIPVLRAIRRRIPGLAEWDPEFEKDIEQWFRGSLVLLAATKNAELWLMAVLNAWWGIGAPEPAETLGFLQSAVTATEDGLRFDLNQWWISAGRLLLAIGVIESMPDQELFAIIHPGPRWRYDRKKTLRENASCEGWQVMRGLLCQHLNRSSPMFAILSVFFGGAEGWIFYSLAILQYLIIGLVTSRDRAIDVLIQFDHVVAKKRQEIIEEFELGQAGTDSSRSGPTAASPVAPDP